mgnify:CR=1 FL=1
MEFSDNEKKLLEFFVEREGKGIIDEIKTIDLVDAGILDSLDMVNLAEFIEQEFGKKIDLTDTTTLSSFSRFGSLMKLIGD